MFELINKPLVIRPSAKCRADLQFVKSLVGILRPDITQPTWTDAIEFLVSVAPLQDLAMAVLSSPVDNEPR